MRRTFSAYSFPCLHALAVCTKLKAATAMTEERSICYENECTGLVDKNANGKRNIYITMTLGTDLNCFFFKRS